MPVKVFFLTHQYFPRHVGGTEVYARSLVRRLSRAGHEAVVITCHEDPSGQTGDLHVERSEHEGVPVIEVHFNLSTTAHPARYEFDHPAVAGALDDLLATERPDLVHALHVMKLSGAALESCFRAGVPVIVTLCDYWFLCPRHTLLHHDGGVCTGPDQPRKCVACVRDLHGFAAMPDVGRIGNPSQHQEGRIANPSQRQEGRISNPSQLQEGRITNPSYHNWQRYAADLLAIDDRPAFLRKILLGSDRIIALSQFQKRVFVQNGFPPERIEVIAHGLDLDDLRTGPAEGALNRAHGPRCIGFVGSLVPHKGAHVLLQALARSPALDVECRIHGPLPDGNRYVEQVKVLASRDLRVRLMGAFEPAATGQVLRALDLLAVPALWHENEPLVVKAALHLGVPILASRIGSVAEMIAEGRNGWLAPPGDTDAWAQALTGWMKQPRRRFAPTPVKTIDDNAREIFSIYESLTGGKPCARKCI